MSDEQNPEPTPSLPTRSAPSGPPSTPTDAFQKVRVVGTVVAAGTAGCVDVKDANGVLWSLLGDGVEGLGEGDHVTATGQAMPEAERAYGNCAGAPVRVQKLTKQD